MVDITNKRVQSQGTNRLSGIGQFNLGQVAKQGSARQTQGLAAPRQLQVMPKDNLGDFIEKGARLFQKSYEQYEQNNIDEDGLDASMALQNYQKELGVAKQAFLESGDTDDKKLREQANELQQKYFKDKRYHPTIQKNVTDKLSMLNSGVFAETEASVKYNKNMRTQTEYLHGVLNNMGSDSRDIQQGLADYETGIKDFTDNPSWFSDQDAYMNIIVKEANAHPEIIPEILKRHKEEGKKSVYTEAAIGQLKQIQGRSVTRNKRAEYEAGQVFNSDIEQYAAQGYSDKQIRDMSMDRIQHDTLLREQYGKFMGHVDAVLENRKVDRHNQTAYVTGGQLEGSRQQQEDSVNAVYKQLVYPSGQYSQEGFNQWASFSRTNGIIPTDLKQPLLQNINSISRMAADGIDEKDTRRIKQTVEQLKQLKANRLYGAVFTSDSDRATAELLLDADRLGIPSEEVSNFLNKQGTAGKLSVGDRQRSLSEGVKLLKERYPDVTNFGGAGAIVGLEFARNLANTNNPDEAKRRALQSVEGLFVEKDGNLFSKGLLTGIPNAGNMSDDMLGERLTYARTNLFRDQIDYELLEDSEFMVTPDGTTYLTTPSGMPISDGAGNLINFNMNDLFDNGTDLGTDFQVWYQNKHKDKTKAARQRRRMVRGWMPSHHINRGNYAGN